MAVSQMLEGFIRELGTTPKGTPKPSRRYACLAERVENGNYAVARGAGVLLVRLNRYNVRHTFMS